MRIIKEKDVKASRIAGEKGFVNYQNLLKTDKIGIAITTVEPNSIAPKPVHSHREKQFNFIVEGEAILICGGKETNVGVGDLVIFDDWEDHSFKTIGDKNLRSVEIKLYE